MPRLTRLAAAGALVLGLTALPVAQVSACSCMAVSPEEAARLSDAVFSGTVVFEEPLAMPMPGNEGGFGAAPARPMGEVQLIPLARPGDNFAVLPVGPMLYRFEVDGVAVGEIGSEVEVVAGGDGAGCGMSFMVGDRWMIFATVQGDALTTGLCSGNVQLAADEEPPLAVSPPGSSPGDDEGGEFPVGVAVPVAAIAALAALSAYLFWRADRPT